MKTIISLLIFNAKLCLLYFVKLEFGNANKNWKFPNFYTKYHN